MYLPDDDDDVGTPSGADSEQWPIDVAIAAIDERCTREYFDAMYASVSPSPEQNEDENENEAEDEAENEAENEEEEENSQDFHWEIRSTASSDSDAVAELQPNPAAEPPLSSNLRVCIPSALMQTPISSFEPFEPPHEIVRERVALSSLITDDAPNGQTTPAHAFLGGYKVNDFVVYCDTEKYPQEMRPLHHFHTKAGLALYFDGTLTNGIESFHVQRVPIAKLGCEGSHFGVDFRDLQSQHVWIRSARNANTSVYYNLGRPAPEYARFYEPFLWLADLARHLIKYLNEMSLSDHSVTLLNFQSNFSTWSKMHCQRNNSGPMLADTRSDYRTAVVANVAFLYKETLRVLGEDKTKFHVL